VERSTQADQPDDAVAAELRGFGPIGLLAILVILGGSALSMAFGALLVLAWAQRSRTPWRAIGYVRPRSWVRALVLGVVSGVAFKLVMKAIVMPLLGADPINHAYHGLVGNTAALPGTIVTMIVVAGFGEETVFRGFLFERLGRWFGTSAGAKIAIVVLTAALFALAHLHDQGLAGAEQAAITGLAFGTAFALSGELAAIMVAHAAFDLTAVAIIYANLEARVAHLVFK
jgi:hypothetical protein